MVRPPKYTYNFNFFSKLNTISCYWAGFIAADGNLSFSSSSPKLTITLAHKDADHLRKFKIAIGFTGPIHTIKHGLGKSYIGSRLDIYRSGRLIADLGRLFNVTPNKSLSLRPPLITNEDHIRAFIRGYIDGDGSIGWSKKKRYPSLQVLGTKDFLLWLREHLRNFVPSCGKPNPCPSRPGSECYLLHFNAYYVNDIFKWLYLDSDDSIRLTRKYKITLV